MRVGDLVTPALLVDAAGLRSNLATMAAARPGARLRPHVKAHKCTALAREQAAVGHRGFTCATAREVEGMAAAGLGEDLLLANEVVSVPRLRACVERVAAAGARLTVAVDSEVTVRVAAEAGVREVLVDVSVGLPRCGCAPEDAGRLAASARAAGLSVRGVMGYEGHLMLVAEEAERARLTEACMALLGQAADDVGSDIGTDGVGAEPLVSGGGTGTWAVNTWVTELQAGSYALMDTAYTAVVPFAPALSVLATVVSASTERSGMPAYAVADAGLKSLGMDHGNPTLPGASVWFCSDEHVTFARDAGAPVAVGERVRLLPAHVDPTVALHERLHLVDEVAAGDDGRVLEVWPVDLRGW